MEGKSNFDYNEIAKTERKQFIENYCVNPYATLRNYFLQRLFHETSLPNEPLEQTMIIDSNNLLLLLEVEKTFKDNEARKLQQRQLPLWQLEKPIN